MSEILAILTFQGGYNTNLVLVSAMILGLAAGLVGSFIFLRQRTLISDAVSHATLPGIGIGFLVAFSLGLEGGRHLPTLMAGAALTGALAAISVQWIKDNTRLSEDIAIGSVLSVYYGGGVVLLSFIQRLKGAAQAGLDSFLLGQVTGTTLNEAYTITLLSLAVLVLCLLFLKELCLLCFDREFAQSIGAPVTRLDILLLALMLVIVCTGLKTVGMILILALLIIPPVTARLWTADFKHMLILASLLGVASAFFGAALSAHITNMPTGGAIVLSAAAMFTVSLLMTRSIKQ